MKVVIEIDYNNYRFESNIIEWPFEILPKKGDIIQIDRLIDLCKIKWEYDLFEGQTIEEAQELINEDYFTFNCKSFKISLDGQPYIELTFEP